MELRNCILIALAFNATPQEVEAAHDAIDRQFVGLAPGSINPQILVTAQVDGASGGITNTGPTTPIAATHTGAPQVATVAANVQLDSTGLPWDERIHSSNRQMTEKNVWRMKRGVTPELKSKVEGELRSTLGAVADRRSHDATPPAATPVSGVIAPPALPGAGLPPMPGAVAVDPATAAYTALVQFIAQNTQSAANPAGKFTDDYINQVLKHYGVADGSLQNLAHAPQLVPVVSEWLHSALAAS